jgi:hypothetical protein
MRSVLAQLSDGLSLDTPILRGKGHPALLLRVLADY